MSYHQDRFRDHSLLIFKDGTLCALFPANEVGGCLFSHQGLTFGGLLCHAKETDDSIEELIVTVMDYYRKARLKSLYIKLMPSFVDSEFVTRQQVIWHKLGAANRFRETTMAIDYADYQIHKSKLKRYRKLKDSGFDIFQTADFKPFWNLVLIPRLQSKHKVAPVHSLEEIELLAHRFPKNIIQYCIAKDGLLLAGITLFVNDQIVKSQYGATTDPGEALYALDILFISLIEHYDSLGFRYFDMGSVRSDDPNGMNLGLWKHKQELGCTEFIQSHFEMQL